MRILVISDTHAKCQRVYNVYKKLIANAPIDMIVHCGDYYTDALEIQAHLGRKVVWVKGNSDGCFDENEYAILETEAGNFFVSHGHLQNVGFSQQGIYYRALELECIGALFGHTHRGRFTDMGGFYLMNPGSISYPRDASGGSFGILNIDGKNVNGKIYRYDDFMLDYETAKQKSKVKGGYLRELINHSDSF